MHCLAVCPVKNYLLNKKPASVSFCCKNRGFKDSKYHYFIHIVNAQTLMASMSASLCLYPRPASQVRRCPKSTTKALYVPTCIGAIKFVWFSGNYAWRFTPRCLVLLVAVTSTNCIGPKHYNNQLVYVQTVFAERIVNAWNNLPESIDFSTLSRFKRTIKRVRFSDLRF